MADFDVNMEPGFPAGLRVFVVDDDLAVLRTLELMLLKCDYKVTVANHALKALELLRVNKNEFDIVIIDINMPDMDGFKFLEIVVHEMSLPVILLSVDYDFKSVMKGIMHGAMDYLVKPARLEELRLIWKHVAKKFICKKSDPEEKKLKPSSKSEYDQNSHLTNKLKHCRNESVDGDNDESHEDSTAQKRARITWTKELHDKFIDVVKYLGIDRAVPKKILDMMAIPGLTRENVASHLQKYRKGLKNDAMGVRDQLLDNTGMNGHNSGMSLSMAINNQLPVLSSFDRSSSTVYKNMTMTSSYLTAQPSFNGHTLRPSTWLPHPMRHQNNVYQQYMTSLYGSRSGTQHSGLERNFSMTKRPNQLSGYQSFAPSITQSTTPSINQPDFSAQNSQISFQPLDLQATDISLCNDTLSDSSFSNEIEALLSFDEEHQQFSSCSGINVEMGEQVQCDSVDFQNTNLEGQMGGNSSNLIDYTDDFLLVLSQFQQ